MERLISASSSAAVGVKGEVSQGVDQCIVTNFVDPRIPNIPGLDYPNVLYYIDVIRQDVNIGERVAII